MLPDSPEGSTKYYVSANSVQLIRTYVSANNSGLYQKLLVLLTGPTKRRMGLGAHWSAWMRIIAHGCARRHMDAQRRRMDIGHDIAWTCMKRVSKYWLLFHH